MASLSIHSVSIGSTVLHDACRKGLRSVAEKLLHQGAYVGVTDISGYTPLQVQPKLISSLLIK